MKTEQGRLMYKPDCISIVFKGYDMTHKAVVNGARRNVWRHMMHLWGLELITARTLPWDEAQYAPLSIKSERRLDRSHTLNNIA
jgi:hypothetical protein